MHFNYNVFMWSCDLNCTVESEVLLKVAQYIHHECSNILEMNVQRYSLWKLRGYGHMTHLNFQYSLKYLQNG